MSAKRFVFSRALVGRCDGVAAASGRRQPTKLGKDDALSLTRVDGSAVDSLDWSEGDLGKLCVPSCTVGADCPSGPGIPQLTCMPNGICAPAQQP